MKHFFQFLIIGTFLVACSPRYTELNNQGFGGGFSQKGTENNHSHKSIAAESNEIQTTPLKENDLSLNENQNNEIPKGTLEGKKTIFYPSKLIKSELQNLKISKRKIKKLFKPEIKKRQNELSFPDSNSSVWKWILVIWGICSFVFGLVIYFTIIESKTMSLFEFLFKYIGLFGAIGGLILLLIGLLID